MTTMMVEDVKRESKESEERCETLMNGTSGFFSSVNISTKLSIIKAKRVLIDAFTGGLILSVAWAFSTLFHEYFHAVAAMIAVGNRATSIEISLIEGSMVAYEAMSDIEAAIVAMMGTAGLIALGAIFIYRSTDRVMHMVGIVFLSRAWVDSLPLMNLDGGIVAAHAGLAFAWVIVAVEVIISGHAIYIMTRD